MGELFLIFVWLFIVTAILIGVISFSKSDKSLSITLIVSFILVALLGYMNYTATPSNYYFNKILAVFLALVYLIPITLHLSKKTKPLFVKILSVLILVANLLLLFI